MAKENKLSVNVSVRGTYKYPKTEDGKKKCCISIPVGKLDALNNLIGKTWGGKSYNLKRNEDEEITGNVLLNVSSKYDVPMFDTEGNEVEECYHCAEVVAKVSIKEYDYRGKHGVTTYLTGLVIEKQGEHNNGADFKSIMKDIL